MRKPARLALLFVALFSANAFARDTEKALQQMFGDGRAYKVFFEQFQQAARSNDVATMLALIEYPLFVADGDERLFSAEQTALAFDRLFDEQRMQLIREQAFENLHISNAGAAFGQGEIWFGGVCGENSCAQMQVKIVRIGKDSEPRPRAPTP